MEPILGVYIYIAADCSCVGADTHVHRQCASRRGGVGGRGLCVGGVLRRNKRKVYAWNSAFVPYMGTSDVLGVSLS